MGPTLLEEIERDASDSRVPIGNLLRKCQILAVRLDNAPGGMQGAAVGAGPRNGAGNGTGTQARGGSGTGSGPGPYGDGTCDGTGPHGPGRP